MHLKNTKNNNIPVNSGLFNIEFTKNTNKAGGSPLARPFIKCEKSNFLINSCFFKK